MVKQEPNLKAITPSSSLSKKQTLTSSDPKSLPQQEQAKKNENQGPRLSGIKKEPSNIFKSFSKPKAKTESEKANSGGEARQENSKVGSPCQQHYSSILNHRQHEPKTKRTRLDSDEDGNLIHIHPPKLSYELTLLQETMKDASEDEQSEDFSTNTQKAQQTSQSRRKAKLQREEQLRKMMDDDGMCLYNHLQQNF